MRNIHTDKPEHEDDIYTGDLENLQELQDQELYLTELWHHNKQGFFKQFSIVFLDLADAGKITRQTAAYKIADWMFDIELKSIPEIEQIVMVAGILELPYQHATNEGDKASYDDQWQKLKEMIHTLLVDVKFFCTHCDEPFIFTIEEQKEYASEEITLPPNRCHPCRGLHKQQVDHRFFSCEVC